MGTRGNASGAAGSLIQVRGLDKTYRRGSEEIHVLQGLNLDVEKGEFIAFMGPSGSGKTTLLNFSAASTFPPPEESLSPATRSRTCQPAS